MELNANKAIYDQNWPEWVDMQLYGPKNRWLRYTILECLKYLDNEKPSVILDVGCGEGTITYFIAENFPDARINGIDISSTGIVNAQRRWNLPNLNSYA